MECIATQRCLSGEIDGELGPYEVCTEVHRISDLRSGSSAPKSSQPGCVLIQTTQTLAHYGAVSIHVPHIHTSALAFVQSKCSQFVICNTVTRTRGCVYRTHQLWYLHNACAGDTRDEGSGTAATERGNSVGRVPPGQRRPARPETRGLCTWWCEDWDM